MTEPTYPLPPTGFERLAEREAKLKVLRAHLRGQAEKFVEFAESPDLTPETSVLMAYEDAPHCPLGFNVTKDGTRVAIFSGDGVGVSFRFQDIATIIHELTVCAMDAAARRVSTTFCHGIIGSMGAAEGKDVLNETEIFLKEEREAVLKEEREAEAAAEKLKAEALAKVEKNAQPVENMVGELEKIVAQVAGEADQEAVSDDQPETSAEAVAMDEHELKQP